MVVFAAEVFKQKGKAGIWILNMWWTEAIRKTQLLEFRVKYVIGPYILLDFE